MPTYRPNVTDKEQAVLEAAENDSAIPVQWFDGGDQQVGQKKLVKAYDVGSGNAQAPNGTGATSAVRAIPGSGAIIGQHNDQPSVFPTPGKA